MATIDTAVRPGLYETDRGPLEAATSGVAWPAILGGAFAAAALTVVLLALGSGFGLAAVSPWPGVGASAATFSIMTGLWLIITQWLASGLGGYITGRMRTKWVGLHTHEVFFRDTANGLLTWAVTAVVGAVFLASAASSLVGGTASAVANVASGAASGASQGMTQAAGQSGSGASDSTGYFVDSLFRTDHPNPNASAGDARAESGRILLNGIRSGSMPARASSNTGCSRKHSSRMAAITTSG